MSNANNQIKFMTLELFSLQNNILDSMPRNTYERLHSHVERVKLTKGEVLYKPGDKLNFLYFPLTCVLSVIHTMNNGRTSELAAIGNEGMIGVDLFMNNDTVANHVIVRQTGFCYRIPGTWALGEYSRFGGRRKGAMQNLIHRYTQMQLKQIAQIAACNLHHTLEQQLCRWLLLSLDRSVENELKMTHEMIANMLGVRREGISDVAGKLQRAGLIHCNRGHLSVLDRPAIEERACECYQAIRSENERLLPRFKKSRALIYKITQSQTKIRQPETV